MTAGPINELDHFPCLLQALNLSLSFRYSFNNQSTNSYKQWRITWRKPMRRLGPISLDGPLFSPVFFPPQPKIQAPLHCRKRWRHIAFFYSNSATRPMLGPVVCCCPISSQAYLSRSPVGYLGSFGGSSLPLSLPSYSPSSSPPLITTWPSFIASCRLGQIQPALQAGRYQHNLRCCLPALDYYFRVRSVRPIE